MNIFWWAYFRWLVIFISVREETDMLWVFQWNLAGFTSNDLNGNSTLICLMSLCEQVLRCTVLSNSFEYSENISKNLMTVKQYNPQRWQVILLIKLGRSFSMSLCSGSRNVKVAISSGAFQLFQTDCWPTACEFKAPLRETRMSAEYVPAYLVSDEN